MADVIWRRQSVVHRVQECQLLTTLVDKHLVGEFWASMQVEGW